MLKKELEIKLSNLHGFLEPQEKLEQYRTPGSVAAELLHTAFMDGNIEGRTIADLGTGTGILAIGSKILGAKTVYGVDIDPAAIRVAKENEAGLPANEKDPTPPEIKWKASDISKFTIPVDTIVMNPPFGIKVPHADRPFLKKAFEVSSTVYSIHASNPETRTFIKEFVKSLGGTATLISCPFFELPRTYWHHTKELERIMVDMYRMTKDEKNEA